MSLLQEIFSIKNKDNHKIVKILGFKLKLKNQSKYIEQQFLELKKYISNEAFAANFVKDLHNKTFLRFKNCNIGKDVMLVACGPTMAYLSPPPPTSKPVMIGVNRAYRNSELKLDYVFVQDKQVGLDNLDGIVKYPAEIFMGLYYLKPYAWMDKCIIPEKYRNYPNIHYYVSDYSRNLAYPDLEYFGLFDLGSIVFPAMQFALYTGTKRIFIVGCDCSNAGYFDGTSQNISYSLAPLANKWKKFKEYQELYYPDTEIISVNPVGLKGLFKDVYTKSYVEANTELFKDKEITFLEEIMED